jgi:hypothetical protein
LFYLELGDFLDDERATVTKETTDTTDVTVDAMANALVVSLQALGVGRYSGGEQLGRVSEDRGGMLSHPP